MKQRLHDALAAFQTIGRLTANVDFDDYLRDEQLRGAVQWYICVAGEALNRARQLDPEITEQLPEMREVIGMRNRLIHGYEAIDDEVVWTTVKMSVPSLQTHVAALLEFA